MLALREKIKTYWDRGQKLKEEIVRLHKEIAKRDAKVVRAKATAERWREKNRRLVHNNKVSKYKRRQTAKDMREVRQDAKNWQNTVYSELQYLTKAPDWDSDVNRAQVVEIILRTIVTYHKLILDGTITYAELVYLLVGTQMEAFRLRDVVDRYSHLPRFHKVQFRMLLEEGLLKKVYRRQAYHITVAGRDRLNDILRYIYENKVGTYRILKKFFEINE